MSIVKLAPSSDCSISAARDLQMLLSEKSAQPSSEPLFSDISQAQSEVVTGPLAGTLLGDYLHKTGWDCLGKDAQNDTALPISIRLIRGEEGHILYSASKKHASVWLVLSMTEGEKIYFSSSDAIGEEAFQDMLKSGNWKNELESLEAIPGDVLYAPAGTAFACDSTIVFLEVQTQVPALEVKASDDTELSDVSSKYHHGDWVADGQAKLAVAATNNVFELDLFEVDGRLDMDADENSFKVLVFLNGSAVVEQDDTTLHCAPYNSVFVTAGTPTFHITGNCTLALVHLVRE